MSEATFVVCPLATEATPVRGCRFGSCTICRGAVHVAPSSERALREGHALACFPCVLKKAVASDEPFNPTLPSAEQLAEMSREQGRTVTRAEVEAQIHEFADIVRSLQALRRVARR